MDRSMSLQLADGHHHASEPDDPLLPWDEVYQKMILSPRARPSLIDGGSLASTQLSSLLSASSYPVPEPFNPLVQFSADYYARIPPYGGFQIESPAPESSPRREAQVDKTPPSSEPGPAQKKPKRQRVEPASTATSTPTTRKRGRPRKAMEGPEGEDPEERRRMQIRMAQRAYRSRKEANISTLKGRIAQLESAVEKMSTTMISFSDELVQSGVLASHSDLTGHLRQTVQTCLDLAREAGEDVDHDADASTHSGHSSPSTQSSAPPSAPPSLPTLPIQVKANPVASQNYPPANYPMSYNEYSRSSPSEPSEISAMELSSFIERLHVACIYQGYIFLADPSIPMERLRRPFRLLLTMMDRKGILSYFQAALHARVSQRQLEDFKEIPFFCLGGAGTHYPRSTSQNAGEWYPCRSQRWSTVQPLLSRFPPDIQQELGGEWFDIQDLEGYLRENDVRLLASPPSNPKSASHMTVNVARLIPALISSGICLGRAPGFRRRDVERALRAAVWD